MFALFDSSVWSIVQNAATLIALINTVISIYRKPVQKRLAYDLLLSEPLSAIDTVAASNIRIRYPSDPLTHGRVFLIKLVSCGHIPIAPDDYIKPVLITFGNQAKVIKATIINEHPSDLAGSIQVKDNGVQLNLLLLNPNDCLILEIIVNSEKSRPQFNARIVGVRKISSPAPRPVQNALMLASLLFILLAYAISPLNISVIAGMLLIVGVCLNVFVGMTYPQLRQLRLKEEVSERYRNDDELLGKPPQSA